MDIQYGNKLFSSMMLAFDHQLLSNGRAFTNYSGLLYPTPSHIGGYNLFTTPYKQLVNDISITGANIMSGVYVNGVLRKPTTSMGPANPFGLNSINITEGQAFFLGSPTTVSGIYSVKDYNLYITSEPEEKLLFESKMFVRPRIPQTLTGLPQDAQTCPAVFVKPVRGENIPFCLGGGRNKSFDIRAMVFGDSEYSMNAVCDILMDMAHIYYEVIDPAALPFNAWGAFTGVNYDYHSLTQNNSIGRTYVNKVKVSMLMSARQFSEVNPKLFPAFVDFELWNLFA